MAGRTKNNDAKPAATPAPEATEAAAALSQPLFPVVVAGASAGGLEAFNELLHGLGDKPGMALIVIQHQEPKRTSALTQILSRSTSMPVRQVEGGEPLAVDCVFVAPSDAQVIVSRGTLQLEPGGTTASMPIDRLFRSLAEDQGGRAIGVILSGSASDGSLGLTAIKAEGGITFAQDETAKFGSMPQSAVAAGAVDFILPPAEIAQELIRIARHSFMTGQMEGGSRLPDREMARIFATLRKARGTDFTHYKPTTVERRIRRRMALSKVDDAQQYADLVRDNSAELDLLYRDLLIQVTSFFRDPDVFEAVARDVLPAILRDRDHEHPVRIWVPGCATGEEVYSLAIAALEVVAATGSRCSIQIFGTDISEKAIEFARAGAYPQDVVAEMPDERLRRFFTKSDEWYRVNRAVRDCCIFARQDVTKDPPFSKLDLISCRNVMIYLGAVLQRRVISVFHYALNPGGYLLLGSSETIGSFADLFSPFDRKHRIYRKREAVLPFPAGIEHSPHEISERPPMNEAVTSAGNLFREADRVLLARYAPVGVIVNENLDVLQFRGRTSSFLEPAPGTASFNLLKMAREGLLGELRDAIQAARKTDAPVKRESIRIRNNGGSILANLEVIPFASPAKEKLLIILFEQRPPEKKKPALQRGTKRAEPEDEKKATRLRRELDATREYLQSIIEEQEAMNEELRSANEEIQSSNEELQSTNEELETAKEELQSSNEELLTLNEELENRNQELAVVNNDLVNILTAVDIPIVMLDQGLRVRRFNPGAQRVLNIGPSDIGRSVTEIRTPLLLDNLGELASGVIETLETREVDVNDRTGRAFSLRVRPYRTMDNKIDGAVLVLVELR
ncbi:MAG TPA: CheR family methyltransferase [Thermoanaerobaculia bacterium]|nr:CheR family methyltransferase [Thermoanaerobaculia bacterium]